MTTLFKSNIHSHEKELLHGMKIRDKNNELIEKYFFLILGDPMLLAKYLKERNICMSNIGTFSREEIVLICEYCNIPIGSRSNVCISMVPFTGEGLLAISPIKLTTTVTFYVIICFHNVNSLFSKFSSNP